MKHVSILLPEGPFSMSNVDGALKIFTRVNALQSEKGKPPLFHLQLVGLSKKPKGGDNHCRLFPDCLPEEVSTTNLVLIPALQGDLEAAVALNADFVPWIVHQHRRGAAVASLCLGAFLLASTGLLAGKRCTTHWAASAAFRKMFPDVQLLEEAVLVDEGDLYSSGGGYSFLHLLLYLVERAAGRETALFLAKLFEIDIDRDSQAPFMIFDGQKDHADPMIRKAQVFIERHVRQRISVDGVAVALALGRRALERRFRQATGHSVGAYIQRLRVELAKVRLESSRDNVYAVMSQVGYSDAKAFRDVFRRITGLSPLEYKRRYGLRTPTTP